MALALDTLSSMATLRVRRLTWRSLVNIHIHLVLIRKTLIYYPLKFTTMKKYYITIDSTIAGNRKQKAYEAAVKDYNGTLITGASDFAKSLRMLIDKLNEEFPAGKELRLQQYKDRENILLHADTDINSTWYYRLALRYVTKELNF